MASHFSRCGSLIDCQLPANGFSASCCGAVNRFHANVPVAIWPGAAAGAVVAILDVVVTALAASGNCWAPQTDAISKDAAMENSAVNAAN